MPEIGQKGHTEVCATDAPDVRSPSAPAPVTKAARRGDAKSADGARAPVVASGAANTGSGVSHLPDLRERSPAQVLFGTPVQKLATPAPRSVLNAAEGVRARFREIDEQLSRAWRAQDFIDVLQGITDADPIQREQLQQYVIDRALLRFMDLGDINKLADAVPDNPALRKIVVERLLHYAAHYDEIKTAYTFGSRLAPSLTNLPEQQRPKPDSHRQKEFASRCAAVIVEAMDIEPRPRALGEYLAALTREEGKAFALALGGEHDWRNVAKLRELAKAHEHTAVASIGCCLRSIMRPRPTRPMPLQKIFFCKSCRPILRSMAAPRGAIVASQRGHGAGLCLVSHA